MTKLDKFYLWLAFRLPRKLVYWCAVRLIAHATTQPAYQNMEPNRIGCMEALDEWKYRG